ncbi:hypothetical protein SLS60_010143 [Paraconiothyrium brasiliense]|uniref:MFS transporter n=1 Tax=Paraconiothyrium brasiliense TaxID=300254 RepID=A0ABR3QQF0_9PLEO
MQATLVEELRAGRNKGWARLNYTSTVFALLDGLSSVFHHFYDTGLTAFRAELAESAGRFNEGTLAAGLLLCTVRIVQGSPATDDATMELATGVTTPEPLLFTAGQNYVDKTIPMRSGRQRLQWSTPTDESLWKLFYTPALVLIMLPHVIFTGFQWAQGVVWLTVLATIISIVFSAPPYNMNAAQLGYLGIGPMIGNLIGSIYSGVLGDRAVVWLAKRNKGYFEPEFRLYTLITSIIAQAVGLILFGYFIQRGAHWVYPSIGGLLFGFGLGSISDASLTMAIDCYIELTGPSFVAITFIRNAISNALPFSVTPWMAAMNLQNMFILSGAISFSVNGTTGVFVVYGKRIRRRLAPRYYTLIERQARL